MKYLVQWIKLGLWYLFWGVYTLGHYLWHLEWGLDIDDETYHEDIIIPFKKWLGEWWYAFFLCGIVIGVFAFLFSL